MRWDSWEALASKRWVKMEDTSRVDDEGRASVRESWSDGGVL